MANSINGSPNPGVMGMAMGAPKYPQPEKLHAHLGAHKGAFPTGFISQGKPSPTANDPRETQGSVGYDVARKR